MSELVRTPRQLGAIIRNARRHRGLTQAELGVLAGLRQETISLIENGNEATRLDTLLAVLAALDLEFQVAIRSQGQDIEDLIG